MIRVASIPFGRRVAIDMPWWQIGLYALANLPIVIVGIGGAGIDWERLASAPEMYAAGTLYAASDVPYVWSPVAAILLATFIPLGYLGWSAMHVAAVGLLRNPTVILLVALSGAFWFDVAYGSTMTFVFVAGALALGGSRSGGLVFVALCMLMPRPAQLPLLALVLWRNPAWRLPALAIGIVHAIAVAATGYGPAWLAAMMSVGPQQMDPLINWGPTGILGYAWLLAGVPLGAWLMTKGYPGLAGLAVSPYVLPHYVLLVLWDLPSREREASPVGRLP